MESHLKRVVNVLLLVIFLTPLTVSAGSSIAASLSAHSPDMLALQGRWIRTDAAYVIELSYALDSSLRAAYFNPKPINVEKTETAEQGGIVHVLIELQDVNYPGSTYVLSYDRVQDTLKGIYFLPASKQSYAVGFVRQVEQ